MTRHKRKPARVKLLRSLFLWHRHIGLASALFVILLTLTGLLLNHTDDFSLDSRHVESTLVLDWYGINAPETMRSYTVGSITVTEVGMQVYWNTTSIPQASAPLLGTVAVHGLIIIGVEGQLLLFTPDGELIERLDNSAGVPTGMQALGSNAAGELVVKTAHGIYQADSSFLKWHETADAAVTWTVAVRPPPTLRAALQQAYRGTGLTLERLLLDIHSGRILGSRGVYLVDAAALLFLVLAVSGVWLWLRHHANAREHRRSRQQQTRV
jgi:uncharacterized iron-regulated membrane protein